MLRHSFAALAATALLGAQSPLITLTGGANSGAPGGAVFFNLEVAVAVRIERIDFLCSSQTAPGTGALEVYLGPATYVGATSNAAAWQQVAATPQLTVAPATVVQGNLQSGFELPPGSYSLALVSRNFSHGYTTGDGNATPGTGTNQTFTTAEMVLRAGAAQNVAFSSGVLTPRVFNGAIHYGPAASELGGFTTYGAGCAGSNGVPAHLAYEFPTVGNVGYSLAVARCTPLAPAVLLLGATQTNLALDGLGAVGCRLLVDPAATIPSPCDASGFAQVGVPIPRLQSLLGVNLFSQWLAFDASANRLGLVFSDGGRTTIGEEGPMPVAASADILRGAAPGESVLRMRFADSVSLAGLTINPDGNQTLLRDDGRGPDPIAGDGLFHTIVRADFDAQNTLFLARRTRIRARPTVPFFDGRQLNRLVPGSSLLAQIAPNSFQLVTSGLGDPIDPAKSLMITDPSVINDPLRTFNPCTNVGNPNGVWTFKHLMTEMCNQPVSGVDPKSFVLNWINHFAFPFVVNTRTVPARGGATAFINNWPKDSNGNLDLDRAPFRLLAIINRLDLRKASGYGRGNAGEARFVFCSVNCSNSTAQQFLVIFEYGVPISGCPSIKAWGQDWADLSNLAFGPAFNAALQALTLRFTERNLVPGNTGNNRSAIAQVRTNEIDLDISLGREWELREFRIGNGLLGQVTVAQTPDLSFDNTATLRDFLNSRGAGPRITQFLNSTPFLAGSALVRPDDSFHWKTPATLSTLKRHRFSLNTCNGCHAGETETAFTHVKPAFFPARPQLSQFLAGDSSNSDGFHDVADPASSGAVRKFFDLDRRREDLDNLVNSDCFTDFLRRPLVDHLLMFH